jgi:hypothetical protein
MPVVYALSARAVIRDSEGIIRESEVSEACGYIFTIDVLSRLLIVKRDGFITKLEEAKGTILLILRG